MAFDRSEFLATFTDEAKDHLQDLNNGLLALEKDPTNKSIIEEMFRAGHTLKGAARMMSFDELKEISHCIEDIFQAIHTQKIFLDQNLTNILFEAIDILSQILDEIILGKDIATPWKDIVKKLHETYDIYLNNKQTPKKSKTKKSPTAKGADKTKSKTKKPPATKVSGKKKSKTQKPIPTKKKTDSDPVPDNSSMPEDSSLSFATVREELEANGVLSNIAQPVAQSKTDATDKNPTKTTKKPNIELEEYIKVSISKINNILNLVGEMVINKINSNEKLHNIKRIYKQSKNALKQIEDLSSLINNTSASSFADSQADIGAIFIEISQNMGKTLEDIFQLLEAISTEIFHLDPIIDELQFRMKQVRMLPVRNLFETMPRLVRDIATDQNKQVDLIMSGEDTELDKKVLELMKNSFIHLLRNSIDHGIESPEERVKIGKPAKGTISLKAFYKGGNVIIEIKDDGKGIAVEKVKEKAISKGLLSEEDAKEISQNELINFIFAPGFSTAPLITDISGRGVGLDVVKTDIASLKGTISVETEPHKGTLFTLQLPLTVAIIQVLLVRCGTEIFSIPLLSVNESIIIDKDEIFTIENRAAFQLRNKIISVIDLTEIIQLPPQYQQQTQNKEDQNKHFIVIINSMERLLGMKVDEILGEQEVFIKTMSPRLGNIPNISGVTVLGNGQVILILDVLDIFNTSKNLTFANTLKKVKKTEESDQAFIVNNPTEKKHILIVEDSLTTRELERSILESHGYEVDTANDGIDAINKVQFHNFDIIVSDINMPKMNGFELCKKLKSDKKTKDIPFIIVSSLEEKEHKKLGIEAGAQAYIIKSAFDQSALISTIKKLL